MKYLGHINKALTLEMSMTFDLRLRPFHNKEKLDIAGLFINARNIILN